MLKMSFMRSAISILALVGVMPLTAHAVTLTPIVALNKPVGITHHQPTNKIIVSVNYPSGSPHTLERISSDGTLKQFSSAIFPDEAKLASPGNTLGGFTIGEVFLPSGVNGVIVRISANGSTITNPWPTLPGEKGHIHGGLHFDETGVFGGDLIVSTTRGNVWRVNSSGTSTLITKVGSVGSPDLEGLTTVPNDPGKYGPWAGKIVV